MRRRGPIILSMLLSGCRPGQVGGDDELASSSEVSDTNTSFATEDVDDSQPSGEPTPLECQSDDDCELGNCIGNDCVVCRSDADCIGVLECDPPTTCDSGTCVASEPPCAISGCHTSWCAGQCNYELCPVFDDVVDIELRMLANDFTPSAKLDVGGELRVLGLAGCGEIVIVRDIVDDELLMMWSRGTAMNPLDVSLAAAFESMELEGELHAPLVIDFVDHASCPPELETCAMVSRGSVDIEHQQQLTRVLDGTLGWAAGGYLVSANALWFEQEPNACGRASDSAFDVLIARDACAADCPPPTFESQCVPALEPRPTNAARLAFTFVDPVPWDRWDFHCKVLDASTAPGELGELEQVRALDCAALYQPDLTSGPPWCGG